MNKKTKTIFVVGLIGIVSITVGIIYRLLPSHLQSNLNTYKTGEFVIKPQFDFARDFSEGLAAVKVGDKWGYIHK